MATAPKTEGRLKGFRLRDVPLDIRVSAALAVARSGGRAIQAAAKPEDRLFARLLSDAQAADDSTSFKALRRIAERPSERVYWVTREAWDRVMGGHP